MKKGERVHDLASRFDDRPFITVCHYAILAYTKPIERFKTYPWGDCKKIDILEHPVNDQLRELLREGKDVEAVKLAREELGFMMVEGKEYVDELKKDVEVE